MRTAGVTSLPSTRLSFTLADGELVPTWLGDRDRPWLRDLLAEAEAFVGRPFVELASHWRRSDPDPRAGPRQAAAVHVLGARIRTLAMAPTRTAARQELFAAVARGLSREVALATVAARHHLSADQLAATLYADLPQQRCVCWPDPPPDPGWLALATNLAMVRGLLRYATSARAQLRGASRALLKTAWLCGAVPAVGRTASGETILTWRAVPGGRVQGLPSLVALLPWARRFTLRARCELPGARGDLVIATGDPILPGPEPRRFDSQLERRFERDLRCLRPQWEVVREPVALLVGSGLAFPDFELRSGAAGMPWYCEIAGLRDRAALSTKVRMLTECERLVLCLPAREVPDALVGHPRVVPFRRQVPAAAVVAVVEATGDRWRRQAEDAVFR